MEPSSGLPNLVGAPELRLRKLQTCCLNLGNERFVLFMSGCLNFEPPIFSIVSETSGPSKIKANQENHNPEVRVPLYFLIPDEHDVSHSISEYMYSHGC